MEYEEIVKELNLNAEKDIIAAKLLNDFLANIDVEHNIKKLQQSMQEKAVIVFGAGPSLREDIKNIKQKNLQNSLFIIAADKAIKILLEEGKILPNVLVTDLDGDKESTLKANSLGVLTVVHAHGDNIPQLKEIVPKLKNLKNVIGTTQTKEFGKLKNFGGFTDGDRAIHLAEEFGAKFIILAGMDFGKEIGKKFKIGKILLEKLAKKSNAIILNITKNGENLIGIPRISVDDLEKIC